MSTPNNTPATFAFQSYTFTHVEINTEGLDSQSPLELSFTPSGIYDEPNQTYHLQFGFKATQGEDDKTVVEILCKATFLFRDKITLEEIPDYFYPNSLAIVFPYIRAFVSSVTLQTNIPVPILLPTMNLMAFKDVLKKRTTLPK